jgi:S-adenosylhomocysteine hydrolase
MLGAPFLQLRRHSIPLLHNCLAVQMVNKVAVVTGAGAGIGRASASKFASEGCNVLIVDTDAVSAYETWRIIIGEDPDRRDL